MNKSEMAEKLAHKCDISQAKAAEIISCIFDTKPGKGIIAIELDADRAATRPPARRSRSRPRSTRRSRPARVSKIASHSSSGFVPVTFGPRRGRSAAGLFLVPETSRGAC